MQKPWCFHLSLNVASLARSIDFYRVLFGMEPAKCHDDYAKFEVAEPPLVFSLVPHAPAREQARSRVGLTLPSPEPLQQVRSRLENRGVHIRIIDGAELAFGVADPDGNAWQFSVGDDDPPWDSTAEPGTSATEAAPTRGDPVVWEHYVTAALPECIPHGDASVDEIRLTGTFNGPHQANDRQRLLADAFRVLKPGGKVVVHALAADRPFPGGVPKLPGLAAMVSQVPLHNDIPTALKAAGFVGLHFVKFGAKAWFEHDGVEMREIKTVGWKLADDSLHCYPPTPPPATKAAHEVIYRGPFAQVCDDQGHVYARGRRMVVSSGVWAMLRQGPQAAQFVFVEPAQIAKTCRI